MVQSLSIDFGLSIRWSSVRGLGRKFARHGHQIFIDWVRVVNFIFHFFKHLQYALFNLKVSLRMHSALAYAGYEDAVYTTFEIFILPTLDQHGVTLKTHVRTGIRLTRLVDMLWPCCGC